MHNSFNLASFYSNDFNAILVEEIGSVIPFNCLIQFNSIQFMEETHCTQFIHMHFWCSQQFILFPLLSRYRCYLFMSFKCISFSFVLCSGYVGDILCSSTIEFNGKLTKCMELCNLFICFQVFTHWHCCKPQRTTDKNWPQKLPNELFHGMSGLCECVWYAVLTEFHEFHMQTFAGCSLCEGNISCIRFLLSIWFRDIGYFLRNYRFKV